MQKFTEVNTEGAVSKFLFEGLVLVDSGDPEAALQAYDRAVLLEPEFAMCYLHRAPALIALERYDEAISDLGNYYRLIQ